MNLNKKQKRLVILLAVLLAYAVFDFVMNKDEYLEYYSKKKITAKAKSKKAGKKAPPALKKKSVRVEYTQNWGSDPFYEKIAYRKKRRAVRARKQVSLRLKAISYSGKSSVAMINNRVMMKGDVISGYRVVEIQPKSVILANGNERRVLHLK